MSMLLLFWDFIYIGALSFGGGYGALPLISQQCVEVHNWITMTEFSVLLTISDITPGPIAIDAAAFVGVLAGGIPGALLATLGFMLPPFIVSSFFYLLYKKYGELHFMQSILSILRPAVVGLIAVASLKLVAEALWDGAVTSLAGVDIFAAVLALTAFFVLRKWKVGTIKTILACGAVGVLWEFITAHM